MQNVGIRRELHNTGNMDSRVNIIATDALAVNAARASAALISKYLDNLSYVDLRYTSYTACESIKTSPQTRD